MPKITRRGLFGLFLAAPLARLLPKPVPSFGDGISGTLYVNKYIYKEIIEASSILAKQAAETIDRTMIDAVESENF